MIGFDLTLDKYTSVYDTFSYLASIRADNVYLEPHHIHCKEKIIRPINWLCETLFDIVNDIIGEGWYFIPDDVSELPIYANTMAQVCDYLNINEIKRTDMQFAKNPNEFVGTLHYILTMLQYKSLSITKLQCNLLTSGIIRYLQDGTYEQMEQTARALVNNFITTTGTNAGSLYINETENIDGSNVIPGGSQFRWSYNMKISDTNFPNLSYYGGYLDGNLANIKFNTGSYQQIIYYTHTTVTTPITSDLVDEVNRTTCAGINMDYYAMPFGTDLDISLPDSYFPPFTTGGTSALSLRATLDLYYNKPLQMDRLW